MQRKVKDEYKIEICKYDQKDVIRTSKGVFILGKDTNNKSIKFFVYKNQIADNNEYLYIPNDKTPTENMLNYNQPICKKVMEKYRWLLIKQKYEYKFHQN